MIEEQQTSNLNRRNKEKDPCTLKIGDVIKSYVHAQSRADTGLVGKLSYRARGPFIITKDLVNNSFEVQRYGVENSATRKYKNTDLCLLPPALFLSKVLDTID